MTKKFRTVGSSGFVPEGQISKKLKVSIAALGLICVVIGVLIGNSLATTPSQQVWISGGNYPGAPSYTVWRQGSNYFAKNEYGEVKYDSTNASEVANDVADSGQVKILLTEGTFYFDTPIYLGQYDVLEGNGFRTKLMRSDDNVSIIRNKNIADDPSEGYTDLGIVVRNLQIDCTGHDGGIYDDVIDLGHTGRVLIENVMITNAGGENDAMDLDGCKNVKISHCFFYSVGGAAVHLSSDGGWTNQSGCQYVTVENCYADDCGKTRNVCVFNVYCHADAIQPAMFNKFENCIAQNCYGGGSIDCYHTESKHNGFVDFTVEATTNDKGIGLQVGNYSYVHGARINNPSTYGVWVTSYYSEVKDVTVQGSANSDGVILYQCENSKVIGCTCYDNDRDGIRINDCQHTSVISSITHHNSGSGIKEVAGSGVDYSKVIGCVSYSNDGAYDIYKDGSNSEFHACLNGTDWIS